MSHGHPGINPLHSLYLGAARRQMSSLGSHGGKHMDYRQDDAHEAAEALARLAVEMDEEASRLAQRAREQIGGEE